MANAWNNVIVGSTNVTLFKAARCNTNNTPGTDIDGATAVSVVNSSDEDILLFCRGHHGNPTGSPTPLFPLPAGKSVTFRVTDDNPNSQIDEIVAIRANASNAACGGGVVERR